MSHRFEPTDKQKHLACRMMGEPFRPFDMEQNQRCTDIGEVIAAQEQYQRTAATLARDLEGACRRLAELGEPMSKPQSLVDWDKMKEGV